MKFQDPPSALLFTSRLERPTLHLISWLAVWVTISVSVYLFDRGLRGVGGRVRQVVETVPCGC